MALDRSLYAARQRKNAVTKGLALAATIFGLGWLVLILGVLLWNGVGGLSLAVFTEMTPPPGQAGGLLNPIIGSLILTILAVAIGTPIGILAGTYLAELNPDSRLAATSRFLAKVLTGFPSILAGVFVYAIIVLAMGTYSAWAGGVSLAVLMLPTVVLTAEEAMKTVPRRMKDAALGMGCTRTQMIWKIVLPTALPGILTGVILGVARVAGESAPLLFTALVSNYWLTSLREPTASLSILIYNFSSMPFDNQIELAWAASLVLVLIVLVFNILSRALGRSRL